MRKMSQLAGDAISKVSRNVAKTVTVNHQCTKDLKDDGSSSYDDVRSDDHPVTVMTNSDFRAKWAVTGW